MLHLRAIKSHDGGLHELNETFEIIVTADKLFLTICVHKLTCYLALLVLSFRALDTNQATIAASGSSLSKQMV